jgi:hypothetical protein
MSEEIKQDEKQPEQGKRGPKGPSKYTRKFIKAEAEALEAYLETTRGSIPFVSEFASKRGYNKELVSLWAKKEPKFSHAYSKLKMLQETALLKAGLAGKINPTFGIFCLKNLQGYKDTQDLKHSGAIDQNHFFEEIIRKAAERKRKKEAKSG